MTPLPDIQAPCATQPSSTDVLIALLVTFLTPLFLTAGGDVSLARAAAYETITAYRTRNAMDLFAVVQIIGFGMAALGSLSLSMGDGLSMSMILRLRGNAAALNRAAEQNRRALEASRHRNQAPADWPGHSAVVEDPEEQARYEAGVLESLRQTQELVARANGEMANQNPSAPPPADAEPAALAAAGDQPEIAAAEPLAAMAAQPEAVATAAPVSVQPVAAAASHTRIVQAAPVPAAAIAARPIQLAQQTQRTVVHADPPARSPEEQYRAMWARSMTVVAAEYTAGMQNLPPAQRKLAAERAAALTSSAAALVSGRTGPDAGLPRAR
jgi:hypothetical protein